MTDPNGAAIYGVSINIPAPWSPTHPRWGEKSPPWITTMMPCLLGDDGQQGGSQIRQSSVAFGAVSVAKNMEKTMENPYFCH